MRMMRVDWHGESGSTVEARCANHPTEINRLKLVDGEFLCSICRHWPGGVSNLPSTNRQGVRPVSDPTPDDLPPTDGGPPRAKAHPHDSPCHTRDSESGLRECAPGHGDDGDSGHGPTPADGAPEDRDAGDLATSDDEPPTDEGDPAAEGFEVPGGFQPTLPPEFWDWPGARRER